ncbi:hypothetical protein IIY24_00800 [Candidatus Saccharibacteria bacterium]|nr:hypothetical protein [Candidatus Saccharibacteria bacterium]
MDTVYLVGVTRIQDRKGSYRACSHFPRAAFTDFDDAYDYYLRVEKEVWFDNGNRVREAYLISMELGEEPDLRRGLVNFDLLEGRIFEA